MGLQLGTGLRQVAVESLARSGLVVEHALVGHIGQAALPAGKQFVRIAAEVVHGLAPVAPRRDKNADFPVFRARIIDHRGADGHDPCGAAFHKLQVRLEVIEGGIVEGQQGQITARQHPHVVPVPQARVEGPGNAGGYGVKNIPVIDHNQLHGVAQIVQGGVERGAMAAQSS